MTTTTYEKMPYTTLALRSAYLGRLAALAHLYGVDVARPEGCSVLEIGCGSGGNLVHLGGRYPASRFVGIDISAEHIALAQSMAQGSQVSNVTFKRGDLCDLAIEPGEFDYIICHGVYSWVPADVRSRLFEVISQALSPNGVAFVSYNVLPGWRQRGAIRDIMLSGAACGKVRRAAATPSTLVQDGLELLKLVGSVRNKQDDLYGSYIRSAIERLSESDPSYLFHEFLEEHNEPTLFSDFMGGAAQYGLQFLSEAKPSLMSSDDLGPEVASYLASLAPDVIAHEQCLDMFRNRMFRETLLCHNTHALKRDLKASVFKALHFVTDYRKLSSSGSDVTFREVVSGGTVRIPRDQHATVLALLGEAGCGGATFRSLYETMASAEVESFDERALMHMVVGLWRSGFVDVTTDTPAVARVQDGVAHISQVARHQVANGAAVTALDHRSFYLSDLELAILRASDGERKFSEVVRTVQGDKPLEEVEGALTRLLELGFYALSC